jgi:hypothetical protein
MVVVCRELAVRAVRYGKVVVGSGSTSVEQQGPGHKRGGACESPLCVREALADLPFSARATSFSGTVTLSVGPRFTLALASGRPGSLMRSQSSPASDSS